MDTASEQTAPAPVTDDPHRQEMITLSEEITRLTGLWCSYCAVDHHKDRDMHAYIEAEWSYDNAPVFVPYHNGYVADRWRGPNCTSMLAAMKLLAQHLHNLLGNAYRQASEGGSGWDNEAQQKYALDNFAEYA